MTQVRYAVNCSILLTELPLLERAAAARAAGFGAVEFWWPFPQPVPPDAAVDAFEESVRSAGVQLVALNLYAGDMAAGHRGVLSVPGQESALRDSVDVAAGIAAHLGCRRFNALYGRRLDGIAPEQQDELATENLAMAAAAVAPAGGTILIEPLSAVPGYPVRTAADALAVIGRAASRAGSRGALPNIALLADFYHLAVNGEDVPDVIARHVRSFGHVQIADAPGRGAPGTGTLPLRDWVALACDAGYDGFVSLEYQSAAPDPFGWLAPQER